MTHLRSALCSPFLLFIVVLQRPVDHLPSSQVSFVIDCTSHQKQKRVKEQKDEKAVLLLGDHPWKC